MHPSEPLRDSCNIEGSSQLRNLGISFDSHSLGYSYSLLFKLIGEETDGLKKLKMGEL
jgi:hypothetical protein